MLVSAKKSVAYFRFSTRIDQYDGGIMVTMDAISKVMKSKDVLEQMTDWVSTQVSSILSSH